MPARRRQLLRPIAAAPAAAAAALLPASGLLPLVQSLVQHRRNSAVRQRTPQQSPSLRDRLHLASSGAPAARPMTRHRCLPHRSIRAILVLLFHLLHMLLQLLLLLLLQQLVQLPATAGLVSRSPKLRLETAGVSMVRPTTLQLEHQLLLLLLLLEAVVGSKVSHPGSQLRMLPAVAKESGEKRQASFPLLVVARVRVNDRTRAGDASAVSRLPGSSICRLVKVLASFISLTSH